MHLAGTILPIFAIILTGWFAGASGYHAARAGRTADALCLLRGDARPWSS